MSKRPLEFYGRNVTSKCNWEDFFESARCPYISKKCLKQRKSDSSLTIGACILGFQSTSLIICPQRFLEKQTIFIDSLRYLQKCEKYILLPEIPMPGGAIDFFIVGITKGNIVDYIGIEIQSLDTTGSGGIWDAREDLKNGRFGENYSYGVNWKMSAKTILVQMHHKSETFEGLGKKLVLVIQKEFFDYIRTEFRTKHLVSATVTDAVQIHVYNCYDFNNEYRITLDSRWSTDSAGIEEMLRLGKESVISEKDILSILNIKLKQGLGIELKNQ